MALGVDTHIHTDEIEHGDAGNNIENAQAPNFDLPVTLETAEEDIIDNESEPIDTIEDKNNGSRDGEEEEIIFEEMTDESSVEGRIPYLI
jgi:hypothetical protein